MKNIDWASATIAAVAVMLYNAFIYGLFAYVVFWRDASPWWMLFAVVCTLSWRGANRG